MWEDLIQKAKDGGLDVIETYVFWNVHEPSPGNVLHFLLLLYFLSLPSLCFLCFRLWVSLILCFVLCFFNLGFSTILKGDTIWWDSLRLYRKQGSMLISALDLMFVQNGILGTHQIFNIFFLRSKSVSLALQVLKCFYYQGFAYFDLIFIFLGFNFLFLCYVQRISCMA